MNIIQSVIRIFLFFVWHEFFKCSVTFFCLLNKETPFIHDNIYLCHKIPSSDTQSLIKDFIKTTEDHFPHTIYFTHV